MAEVQRNTQTGDMTAIFIEFVMMQAQNASLFLGLTPSPQGGQREVNLDLARLFIDQLTMIQEKTRGNLTGEETTILRNALSNLQMAFYEVAQRQGGVGAGGGAAPAPAAAAAPSEPTPAAAAEPAPSIATAAEEEERESKKRFTKNYGG